MISLRSILTETFEIDEDAKEDAKQQGLEYMSFGRWGKDGKVTHKSANGKLVPVAIKPDTSNKTTTSITPQTSTNPLTTPKTPTNPFSKVYDNLSNSLKSSGFDAAHSVETRKNLATKGLVPLRVQSAGNRVWTRGDGSKHKDWPKIVPHTDYSDTDVAIKKNPDAVKNTLDQYLSTIGAKSIGKASDWTGSSDKSEVYATGDTIFVHRGNYIEVGTKSRFKNNKVWRRDK